MIRFLVLSFICSFGFTQDLGGTFIGFSGGTKSVTQVDVGLTLASNGFTSYGLHVSADSQPSINETTITGSNTSTIKVSASGISTGPYVDYGRVVLMAGVNIVTEKNKYMSRDNSGFNNLLQYTDVQKKGGYIKIGYKLRHILIYGGYSSYYKATVGAGFIF